MPDIVTPDDAESYTGGRLVATDAETIRAVAAALARVRTFCGWHVSPVQSDTVTLRGSGHRWMVLRSLNIVSITSVTQIDCDGVQTVLDPTNFWVDSDELFAVYQRECFHRHYRYRITFTHGYATAEDLRAAVLQLIDTASLSVGEGGSGELSELQVDDVTMEWSGSGFRLAGAVANNPLNESVLYQYRIMAVA